MTNKKSLTLALALTLVSSAGLAACGNSNSDDSNAAASNSAAANSDGSNTAATNGDSGNTAATNSDASASPSASAEPVTITVAGYPQETDKAGRTQWDDKIKKFEAQYPNIKVKPDPWQYDPQQFAAKMAGGTAPDIISLFATEGRVVAERGWAADLSAYVSSWDKGNWYNPDSYKAFTIDGKIYGLPDWQYVMNILYNKKLFRDKGVQEPTADWTWDDLIKTAKALTDRKKGISGLGLPGKGGEATWVWSNFLYQAGGEAETQQDGKWQSTVNTDAGVNALKLYKDLRWTDDVLQPNTSAGGGDINKDFGNGKIAMITHGDWVVSSMMNDYKMKLNDLGIVPMPAMTAEGTHNGVSGGGYTIINGLIKDKATLDACWNWITFDRLTDEGLTSEDKLLADTKAQGKVKADVTIPPVKPDSDYAKKQQAIWAKYPGTKIIWPDTLYATLLKDAHFEPAIDGQAWYAAIAPAIEKVLTDKNADPKEELDTASKTFQSQTLDTYNNN